MGVNLFEGIAHRVIFAFKRLFDNRSMWPLFASDHDLQAITVFATTEFRGRKAASARSLGRQVWLVFRELLGLTQQFIDLLSQGRILFQQFVNVVAQLEEHLGILVGSSCLTI